MNSEAVQDLLATKPELKSSKAKLEAMKPGAYCIHRSWGFGQIRDYDAANRKLIIDFEGKAAHAMDPAFCVNTLDVLPDNHLLVRQQREPEVLSRMVKEAPVELVIAALRAEPHQAATGIDLETTLSAVVGADRFKKWWADTKKKLAHDPRVSVPAKKTEVFVLRDEPVSAEDEVLEQFDGTRSARRRIALGAKLVDVASKKDLGANLERVLDELAAAVRDSNQLTPSERIEGAWVRDDLARIVGRDLASFSPALDELVAEPRDLPDIAEKLPAHLQSRFLDLVYTAHPTDWKEIAFNLLKNSSGKFTTECINFLVGKECAAELGETLARWQVEQNLRAPVLLWIVKNRASRKFSKLLNDLITPRLLSSILFAIDYEALQTAGTRRLPLADILSDDTDLIPDLLATADPETARDLANSLILNQGFEELTKKSLLARFIKLFPGIQSLVSNESDDKGEMILVSRESHERKRQEYETLVSRKIPENSRAIAAAREHGDLRENSEYKMAKQDQSLLLAQKSQLEREMAGARITDFTEATADVVGVGTIVELRDLGDNTTAHYTILGAWDSDPERHVISYKTPLGQGLLSKRVGEKVKLKVANDEHHYEIVAIRRFADGA
jgi:transcription elongation factor GreA